MRQKFNKGQIIFHYSFNEEDLHGYGTILKDTVASNAEDIVLIQVNESGECETYADRIMIPSKDTVCKKCGCVICKEPDYTTGVHHLHYCPNCDDYKTFPETEKKDPSDFKKRLDDSIEEFKKQMR